MARRLEPRAFAKRLFDEEMHWKDRACRDRAADDTWRGVQTGDVYSDDMFAARDVGSRRLYRANCALLMRQLVILVYRCGL